MKRKTIFIVDDDPDDVFLMREAITQSGLNFNVFQASNGCQLLEMLSEDLRDVLILIDMNMPLLNGVETLKAIYANPALQHVRSILISTSDSAELKKEALNSGAMRFIRKPNRFEEYVSLMRDLYYKCF